MSINYGDLEYSPYMIARQEAEADYVTPPSNRAKEIIARMDELVGIFLTPEQELEYLGLEADLEALEEEEDDYLEPIWDADEIDYRNVR